MAHDTIMIKMLASRRGGRGREREWERGRESKGKETGNLASLSLSWDKGLQSCVDLSLHWVWSKRTPHKAKCFSPCGFNFPIWNIPQPASQATLIYSYKVVGCRTRFIGSYLYIYSKWSFGLVFIIGQSVTNNILHNLLHKHEAPDCWLHHVEIHISSPSGVAGSAGASIYLQLT